MNFIKKIISFFVKTKQLAATVEFKINKFIKDHKKEILMTISVLEAIFPAGTGAKKMNCLVSNICCALGYENLSEEVTKYVTNKCQKVYDEFKMSLTNGL